jgi:hypothetical protein
LNEEWVVKGTYICGKAMKVTEPNFKVLGQGISTAPTFGNVTFSDPSLSIRSQGEKRNDPDYRFPTVFQIVSASFQELWQLHTYEK